MSINTSIGLAGIALQADRDTPAAAPTYLHGLTGGSPFGASRSTAIDEVACGTRSNLNAYVESVELSPSFETRAYADAFGLYLAAALGKDTVSGTAAPYTHSLEMGDSLPYLTLWGQVGTKDFTRVDGCKVGELELSFEGNQPLGATVTLMGIDAAMGLASIPGDAEPSCFDGYFVPTDGTFSIDTASATPAEAIVSSGSLTISNNVEATYGAGRVMPSEVNEGKLTVSGSVTVLPDDMSLYRAMLTGSKTGTKPSGKVVYGSFRWVFTHSDNADWTMTVEATHVPFTADYVEVDPSGSAGEVEFSFDEALVTGRGQSPVKVTLVNGVKEYATAPKSVSVEPASLSLKVGESATLFADVDPAGD